MNRVMLVVASVAVSGLWAGTPSAIAIPTLQVTGTVRYLGCQGPVSPSRPIVLTLYGPDDEPSTSVTVNGGSFSLVVPAGVEYTFGYFLDVIPDGTNNVGEPFEAYDDRIAPPFDRIVSSLSGLKLEFDDSGLIPGVGGNIWYSGAHGPVSQNKKLVVQIFSDPARTNELGQDGEQRVSSNGGRFDRGIFGGGSYYVRGVLDLDGSKGLSAGEPFIDCPSPVPAGPGTVLTITVEDGGRGNCSLSVVPTPTACLPLASPTATPTATHTPTPDTPPVRTPTATNTPDACGDRCFGDKNGDGAVTVDEIITAVNNALNGCP